MKTLLAVVLFVGLSLAAWADGVESGTPAPAFTETTVEGTPAELARFRGRAFLIWFTNFSNGDLAAAQSLFDAVGRHARVGVLIVSTEGQFASRARAFDEKYQLDQIVVVDDDGSMVKLYTGFHTDGAKPPMNLVIIDANGQVRGRRQFPGHPPRLLEGELERL
ncbi:MAG: redoxin domain-containing protein [Armatimonadetes bacterium]|nr:redoxin domain-containing protein [Armatimonadota bacterium]